MSRIGKLPIEVPAGVTITIDENEISVKGAKGELTVPHLSDVTVDLDGATLKVVRNNDERVARAQHGLQRALLNNAVIGVTKGFEKKLEVNGVGFRVQTNNPQELEMQLGFSHPVIYKAKEGITLSNKLLGKLRLKSAHLKNLNHTKVKVLNMLMKLSCEKQERQVSNV